MKINSLREGLISKGCCKFAIEYIQNNFNQEETVEEHFYGTDEDKKYIYNMILSKCMQVKYNTLSMLSVMKHQKYGLCECPFKEMTIAINENLEGFKYIDKNKDNYEIKEKIGDL